MNKSIHSFKLSEIKNVAVSMLNSGKYQELFEISCMALARPDADHLMKVLFAISASDLTTANDNEQIKNALLKTLMEEGIEYQKLGGLWRSAIKADPKYGLYLSLEDKRELNDNEWEGLQEILSSPLLIEGLKKIRMDNEVHEKVITNLRRISLLNLLPEGKLKTKHLSYICAIAEQCFYNEYSYYVEEDEKAAIRTLSKDDPVSVALLACYEPLHKHGIPLKFSPIASLKHILKIQVADYQKEQEFKKSIPRLGMIEDNISQNVQAMYEESPYPRWRDLNITFPRKSSPGKILVAGCGTGKFTVSLACQLQDMEFTAIDISTSSISYAKRVAEEYAASNINFIQCDILNTDQLPEKYDFINCTGVLHHMHDPIQGWKKLIGQLNPGGLMLIGLYSTRARTVVEDAHHYIEEKGYKPEIDNIRQFRRDVFNLPADHPLKTISTFWDFYPSSEVRDLVFHIQEKTYDIPELQSTLTSLGLDFMGFRIRDPKIKMLYKQHFPDDSDMVNLDNWHALEVKEPRIFGEMYNFWCRRKEDQSLNIPAQEIFGMGL